MHQRAVHEEYQALKNEYETMVSSILIININDDEDVVNANGSGSNDDGKTTGSESGKSSNKISSTKVSNKNTHKYLKNVNEIMY